MENRRHLTKSLKVLFPDKSSYRVKQNDIPLILYSYECYRRKITEVELSTEYFLSDKYLKSGKKRIIKKGGRLTFIYKKPPSLVYMAGYLKKKFNVRSYTDMLLIALACGMENPSRLLVASQRFQHNRRLSKLSAEKIRKEWIKIYQEAEVMLGAFTEEKIRAVKKKKGSEWQKVFSEIETNLRKVDDLEIAAGLTLYFRKKERNTRIERTHTIDAEKIFQFDTLFWLLKSGNILSPVDLKRISIEENFSPEAVTTVNYLVKKANEEGIEPSALLFYYALSGMPPEVKRFLERIKKFQDKRELIWQLIYIRNNREKFNKQINLPEQVKEYLNQRILVTKSHILKGKKLKILRK
jgi:hypothetical protein